jgi:hypothetical protein
VSIGPQVLQIIRYECNDLLAVRDLLVFEEVDGWGVGLALENAGKASLRISADLRERHIEVSFMSTEFLNRERTFPQWPHCDDPAHRFGLWEVVRSRGQDDKPFQGNVDPYDLGGLRAFVRRCVVWVLVEGLDILDGDLSVTASLQRSRC